MITINEFAKVEMRVGKVEEAADVPGSEKLIRMVVDFGVEKRVIFSGVKKWYSPRELVGRKLVFVVNLEGRKMPSYVETPEGKVQEESQGMVMAVDGVGGKPVFLVPEEEVEIGVRLR